MIFQSPRNGRDPGSSGHNVTVLARSALREVLGDLSAADALDRLRAHNASMSN